MKYVIKESQYRRIIMEQPDEKFDTPENKEILRKLHSSSIESINVDSDDLVDIISAAIDGIPGLGNLVSAGIDIIHTITYCVRYYFAETDNEKIEYATLAFITLGAAFIPIEGNSLPIMARSGLKKILKYTPQEILLIAKKLKIYNKPVFLFVSKGKWKYSILLFLAKVFGGELAEKLDIVTEKLYSIYQNCKNYPTISKPIFTLYNDLSDLKEDCDTAILLSKHI